MTATATPATRRTREIVVAGSIKASAYAAVLVERSRWFELTPLPDDEYQFVVKNESGVPEPGQ